MLLRSLLPVLADVLTDVPRELRRMIADYSVIEPYRWKPDDIAGLSIAGNRLMYCNVDLTWKKIVSDRPIYDVLDRWTFGCVFNHQPAWLAVGITVTKTGSVGDNLTNAWNDAATADDFLFVIPMYGNDNHIYVNYFVRQLHDHSEKVLRFKRMVMLAGRCSISFEVNRPNRTICFRYGDVDSSDIPLPSTFDPTGTADWRPCVVVDGKLTVTIE